VVLFGTPTRYGNMASQLKQFIDRTGKLCSGSRASSLTRCTARSRRRARLTRPKRARWLSLANTFSHWGGILVPPGYTDPVQFRVGNPYGTSHVATTNDGPGEAELATVRYQVRRAIDVTATLKAGRRTSREVA
jgi:NAD(P)H dehydrogenase (quinone)